MAASTATTTVLPPVKSVVVYRNGDPFCTGRRFVVNQRQVANMEAFLTEVTQCIGAPLAVRNLYTPKQGHKVTTLKDLQTGAQYVAAGFERFKKLDYLNTGAKKHPAAREETQAKVTQWPSVSAKWRKFIPVPCILHVFRNGDILCPSFRFIIPRHMRQDLDQILSLITEKVSLRTGAVRRLCSLEGVTVSSAAQLETEHCYVAVGSEKFKKLPYVKLLISKATERNYPGKRRLLREHENRKAGNGPEDQYSDSALLDSPKTDGRRVKSMGDKSAAPAATQQRSRRDGADEPSAFFTRPVKSHSNRRQPRPPLSNESVRPSVFKRAAWKRREELRGALEVPDDENTAIELPVDQRVAEIVDDEEQNNHLHDALQGHAQIIEDELHNEEGYLHNTKAEQAPASEHDSLKEMEMSVKTEESEILKEPEPNQIYSKSRGSSSTSRGKSREDKEIQPDTLPITVEQSYHQEEAIST